jgi:hypothetical protein
MPRRPLTDAELQAYREMGAAVRKLKVAQRRADAAAARRQAKAAALSLTEAQQGGQRR